MTANELKENKWVRNIVRNYPRIYLGGRRKSTNDTSSCWDSNPGYSEYEAVIPTATRLAVPSMWQPHGWGATHILLLKGRDESPWHAPWGPQNSGHRPHRIPVCRRCIVAGSHYTARLQCRTKSAVANEQLHSPHCFRRHWRRSYGSTSQYATRNFIKHPVTSFAVDRLHVLSLSNA